MTQHSQRPATANRFQVEFAIQKYRISESCSDGSVNCGDSRGFKWRTIRFGRPFGELRIPIKLTDDLLTEFYRDVQIR